MSDSRKILNDCLTGQPFAWQEFVDHFLPSVARVINDASQKNGIELTADQKSVLTSTVFSSVSSEDFLLLRQIEPATDVDKFMAVLASRIISQHPSMVVI